MLAKDEVRAVVQSLPDRFTLDELLERLILLKKVHTGLEQVEKGKMVTQEEVKESRKKGQK